MRNHYILLTVDTEALPKRAPNMHVKRLIWGEHNQGTNGVREMCAVADEVCSKLVFFVDACGAYNQLHEIAQVIRWLDTAGHDVQLHAHPEYLSEKFWRDHGFVHHPRFPNQYGVDKATFTIKYFGKFISDITGKPIQAFRAGSFRWNANTIRALGEAGIPLSFNNSMNAFKADKCSYSKPAHKPYLWSNGVIEVPTTEQRFYSAFGAEWWGRFQFPTTQKWFHPPWRKYLPFLPNKDDSFLVLVMHSWSLLYWDENGYAVYKDDKRLEDFRKLVRRLSKDYDIITTADFLDLHARGKIKTTHTVDLSMAEMRS